MSSAHSELYDPHVPRPPNQTAHRQEPTGPPPRQVASKTEMIQLQIDQTKGHISQTLHDLAQRGQKLEDLEETTAMLQESAGVFKTSSKTVQRRMRWKSAKWTIILVVTVIAILAAIIIPVVLHAQGKI